MRLDKFLCDAGLGSRTEVKSLIKSGVIFVNDVKLKSPQYIVSPETDKIRIGDEIIQYQKYLYYLLYKPAGCVTAVSDNIHPTVMQYLTGENLKNCAPVGRLDIDTEGLLLITNDGNLAHRLLSPKHHVKKTYFARLDIPCPQEAVEIFKNGVDIGDDTLTLPATLVIENDPREARLTITEGRFHQVKRMFEAVGCRVTYLKRESMGSLTLGDLMPGEYVKLPECPIVCS